MKGLEAIHLMEQGKIVTDGREKWKIQDGEIVKAVVKSDNYYEVYKFEMSRDYKEYIETEPLTGWERVSVGETYISISSRQSLYFGELHDSQNQEQFDIANYFSTEEKAREINFKQTLFRKLQRFSDENGGNKIDWNDEEQGKYYIRYRCINEKFNVDCLWVTQDYGVVYFISKEVAQKAIELFHDELIEYFTQY